MNRHGISLNPTQEEGQLLRQLWRGDDARARVQRLITENARLVHERDQLKAELARLRSESL